MHDSEPKRCTPAPFRAAFDGARGAPRGSGRRYRDRVSATEPPGPTSSGGEPVVMTVRGPIAPSALGVTLSHDHVLLDGWKIFRSYSAIMDDETLAVEELRRYLAAGGTSLCDPTNIGLGRAPAALR